MVGRDNLETELFTVADLDRVWVELAIGPTDLPMVAEGQTVSVAAHGLSRRAVGKIEAERGQRHRRHGALAHATAGPRTVVRYISRRSGRS